MLNVFITIDVEVWCDGWENLDEKFPSAFNRYIYGPTPTGNYGLPYQLSLLQDHGLQGVFFVEPLFATRFGIEPLAEILGLIKDANQEVQLHLHPEWVDESNEELLLGKQTKKSFLMNFSAADQERLIAISTKLLNQAGGITTDAFRAGNFAANRDTMRALAANGIQFDSSYNASMFGQQSDMLPGELGIEPFLCEGVQEYPVTVFDDGRALRHAQLTACSWSEIQALLWRALDAKRRSFVIFGHTSEILTRSKTRKDPVVINRFRKLCQFLDTHSEKFRTCGFRGLDVLPSGSQPAPLNSPLRRTMARMLEQVYRRRYS